MKTPPFQSWLSRAFLATFAWAGVATSWAQDGILPESQQRAAGGLSKSFETRTINPDQIQRGSHSLGSKTFATPTAPGFDTRSDLGSRAYSTKTLDETSKVLPNPRSDLADRVATTPTLTTGWMSKRSGLADRQASSTYSKQVPTKAYTGREAELVRQVTRATEEESRQLLQLQQQHKLSIEEVRNLVNNGWSSARQRQTPPIDRLPQAESGKTP